MNITNPHDPITSPIANTSPITRQLVDENKRLDVTAELFGINFPMRLEPFVYDFTEQIAREYSGGYWDFYKLGNGGFYMATHSDKAFQVSCENGFEGTLSADALGITVCLYAYSHLSFSRINDFAQVCAQHYHWLREYTMKHPEAGSILRAID